MKFDYGRRGIIIKTFNLFVLYCAGMSYNNSFKNARVGGDNELSTKRQGTGDFKEKS